MFGLTDFWIGLVYVLCLLSTLLCVIYGIIHWNHDGEADPAAEWQWEFEEERIEEQL